MSIAAFFGWVAWDIFCGLFAGALVCFVMDGLRYGFLKPKRGK